MVKRLKLVIQQNIKHPKVYGDSQLVIWKVNDDYETKDDKLMPYKKMTNFLKSKFVTIYFC